MVQPHVQKYSDASGASPTIGDVASPAARLSTAIVVGIDEDDPVLATPEGQHSLRRAAAAVPRVSLNIQVFTTTDRQQAVERASIAHRDVQARPLAPLCWMWGQLARVAVHEMGATCFVLLGDDAIVSPPGWADAALLRFHHHFPDGLGCLVLKDAADPGYPSFAIIGAGHLQIFNKLLPDIFLNQGGDPFLAELYRRVGRWAFYPDVVVHNQRGGIELPNNDRYDVPLYQRVYAPQSEVLHTRTERLVAHTQVEHFTSVDVLVPCGRADVDCLKTILQHACLRPDCGMRADVRVAAVVDKVPLDPVTQQAFEQLRDQDATMRLRINGHNIGASETRNRLLGDCLSELVIFFDDDVVPTPSCIEAYVCAFRDHPDEHGFVGPTRLPMPPLGKHPDWPFIKRLLALGVHMSNVSFFWQAAERVKAKHVGVPFFMYHISLQQGWWAVLLAWGVTANLALKNTGRHWFDKRFPKTGGGEDVDLCLRAAGLQDPKVHGGPKGLMSVPQTVCYHPWWDNGRRLLWRRFFMWAWGDGELVDMYPHYTYRAPPSGPELFWLVVGSLLLILVNLVPSCTATICLHLPVAWQWCKRTWLLVTVLTSAATVVFLMEVLLDELREFWQQTRLEFHQCSPRMRALASVYATSIRFALEAGRLSGHWARHNFSGMLARVGLRFDWFCGLLSEVPMWEQRWAWAGFACHTSAVTCTTCYVLQRYYSNGQ